MTTNEPHYEVVPRTRIRRVTARRMRASVLDKPSVTLHRTVEATAVIDLLARMRTAASDGARPTLTSVLAVLLARTLADDPVMNANLEGDELRRFPDVHLAVAVATDGGLVPPVLRPEHLATHVAAASRLADVAALAQKGKLKPEDLGPSTFTLTSLGAWNIEYFTPILNPPHVGILGIGALKTGQTCGGQPPRPDQHALPLSLTFDHAAVDGVDAARFLVRLAQQFADSSQEADS